MALLQTGTRRLSTLGALARFLFQTVSSWRWLPRAGRRVVNRVYLTQVWFTALQAVPLIIVIAGIISFTVISQAVTQFGSLIGATEVIGQLMIIVIVRELGPLLTALVVVSRSGTAVAAELATNKVMGEVEALESMGIDPLHYLVLPRFAAGVVSTTSLIVVFDIVAIVAGLVAAVASDMSSERYFDLVLQNLGFQDVWVTIVKGMVFGTVLGIVPSFYGLRSRGIATDVPVASSRAVVTSIVTIFTLSALFVVVLGG